MRWTGQLQYLKLVSSQRTHMIMRDGDLRRWTKDAIELACPFPSLGGTRQLRRTLEMAVGIDRFKKTPTYPCQSSRPLIKSNITWQST